MARSNIQSEKLTDGRSADLKPDSMWLAAEDILGLNEIEVEIEAIYRHKNVTFQDGRTKDRIGALKFKGKTKQLIVNTTKRVALTNMFGPDLPNWIGKRIRLFTGQTMLKGEMVNAIFIKDTSGKGSK